MLTISILTATYNRAKLLPNLYISIINNLIDDIQIEWLIMDDGSTDNTREIVENFKENDNLKIKYFFQQNSGKMVALNNLTKNVTGELMVECDSDDILTDNAISIIKKAYEESKEEKDIYAFCFLKFDKDLQNIGKKFPKDKTTMFDLYFKYGEDGEKALVYLSDIRKKFYYRMEKNEKFSTEARLHHEMDLQYKIKCYNEAIMLCEYQKDGYTKNILKVFSDNPFGYYAYFKEILTNHEMKQVPFRKRLYVIKHMILFKVLTKQSIPWKEVKEGKNKVLLLLLYIPGIVKTKLTFRKQEGK